MFRKTIVDRDNGNLYPIYIEKQSIQYIYRKTTIVVLASESVGGRSRATELPCSRSQCKILLARKFRFPSPIYTQFDPVMHATIALDEFEDE